MDYGGRSALPLPFVEESIDLPVYIIVQANLDTHVVIGPFQTFSVCRLGSSIKSLAISLQTKDDVPGWS
jgi:hypothetical protein